jgi:hypothetical protein
VREESEPMEEQVQLSPQQHAYDSMGRTRPFYGDVSQPRVLAKAARARSYRQELIVFVSDYGSATMALNLILNLKRLRYAHYLMVGFNEEACEFMKQHDAELGCVWDGAMEPVVGRFSQVTPSSLRGFIAKATHQRRVARRPFVGCGKLRGGA